MRPALCPSSRTAGSSTAGRVGISRVHDVVNGEVVMGGELLEPDLGAIDKGLMDSALLRDGEDAEHRRFLLCAEERSRQTGGGDKQQEPQKYTAQRLLRRSEHISACESLLPERSVLLETCSRRT